VANKRITTELVVKAVDKYSGMIRNMTGVTGRFADKVRSDVGRLQGLRGPLKLIQDFKAAQSTFGRSEAALRKSREKLKALRAEMKATASPTKKMTQEFERAKRAAERLRQAHEKNKTELAQLQGKLRSAGVNTSDLAGEQRRLVGALGRADAAMGRQVERLQRLKAMQDRITASRERMDRTLARAANLSFVGNAAMATGRRILNAMSAPIMMAVEFESAMSDVRKVVDFESPDAFRAMSNDILELSTRIPMAASGLAEIVAAGGQSGIAQADLTRFAEMAAKIGVAFDISAGLSGESMAKIKTALGLTIDETGLLFDAMNHLSNNMASTAPSVLDFSTRVAADGKVKGFNATETLAFGSAMIAAGTNADVAATSFRNMGKALVRGAASTPKQRAAFKALGLDAANVARSMQEDAVGTTLDVMKRINQLPAHLRSSTVSQIFGDEARGLTPLIGNLDLLLESLDLVGEEREYAGSAEAEYAERAKTTANNMQLLRNQLTRLGVSVGEVVLPPLNDLLKKSQVFIEKLVKWTKEHPKLTKLLVTSGIALGGMAVAGGALLTAASGLIGTLAILRFGLAGIAARGAFAAGEMGLLGRMLPNFGRAGSNAAGYADGVGRHMGRAVSATQAATTSMNRSLAALKWKSVFASIQMFQLWSKVPDDPADWEKFQSDNVKDMDTFFQNAPGLKQLMDGYDRVFEWVHGKPPPAPDAYVPPEQRVAVETLERYQGRENLPNADRLQDYQDLAKKLKLEIAALQEEMDKLGTPSDAYDLVSPDYQRAKSEMVSRIADLEIIEGQIVKDKAALAELTAAFQVLSGTEVTPEISTESIDRALAKVQELAAKLRALPSSGAPQTNTVPNREETPSAGARAFGGPVRAGLPYLVNEQTPNSEWFVPSMSGGILNVSQAQAVFRAHLVDMGRGLQKRAHRVRGAAHARIGGIPPSDTLRRGVGPARDVISRVGAFGSMRSVLSNQSASLISDLRQAMQPGRVAGLGARLRMSPSFGAPQTSVGPAREVTPLAGARAFGGAIRAGLPYLAGERGPEPIFSSQSAFVATNQRMQRLQQMSQRVRTAGLASLAVSAGMVAPSVAVASGGPQGAPGGKFGDARVEIHGGIHITAPSGVSDPEGLVDLLESRLGDRISATVSASFSD